MDNLNQNEPPALPPKTKRNSRSSQPIYCNVNSEFPHLSFLQEANSISPTEPLATATKPVTESVRQRPIPLPRKKDKNVPERVPLPRTNAPKKTLESYPNPIYFNINPFALPDCLDSNDNCDTDSIIFLQKTSPSLMKLSENDSIEYAISESSRKREASLHSYEEVKDIPEATNDDTDIFKFISFKSPLYNSNEKQSTETNYFADRPLIDLEDYDFPPFDKIFGSSTPTSFHSDSASLTDNYKNDHTSSSNNSLDADNESIPPTIPPKLQKNQSFSIKQPATPQINNSNQQVSISSSKKKKNERSFSFKDKVLGKLKRDKASNFFENFHFRDSSSSAKASYSFNDSQNKTLNESSRDSPAHVKCGLLYKSHNHKDFNEKWCKLSSSRLAHYSNSDMEEAEEVFVTEEMTGVLSINQSKQFVITQNSSAPSPKLYFFELNTSKCNGKQLVYGTVTLDNRIEWVSQLAVNIAPPIFQFTERHSKILAAGYLYMKEGTCGSWQNCWLVLTLECQLDIYQMELNNLINVELRKTKAIFKPTNSTQGYLTSKEKGPFFQMDLFNKVLYFQGDYANHTNLWFSTLKQAWTLQENKPIVEQYLTNDNIPVIIDKCLKFISTHGTTTQGIYRVAGSNSKVKTLYEAFIENPWNVHLKADDYSPHEVTSVLKRYLRQFSECLLTEKLYDQWLIVPNMRREDQLSYVKKLLKKLPKVNYQTLKYLISHLNSINDHCAQNLMPIPNLASIFGLNIFFSQARSDSPTYNISQIGHDIVVILIKNYSWLFEIDSKDIEKEKIIQNALQMLREAKIAQRPAGDILVGIYIKRKEEECLNIRITPSMTALEVCKYALANSALKIPLDRLALFEVVCNGEMERPLHFTEIVLAVTLRWATWDEADAKSNYLCIKINPIFEEIKPYIKSRQPISMFSELKYADRKSKSYKKFLFEFVGAKLTCYKEARSSHYSFQWNVEDINWFIGSESKRHPITSWSITFIKRHDPVKRTKEYPYFGNTMCCSSKEELNKWVAALLIAEFPQGLEPSHSVSEMLA